MESLSAWKRVRSHLLSVASRSVSPGSVSASVEYLSAYNSACENIVMELSDEKLKRLDSRKNGVGA